MNRLDPVSSQLALSHQPPRVTPFLLGGTWVVVVLGLCLSLWLGWVHAANPVDRLSRTVSEIPLTVVLVDLWTLGIVCFRRPTHSPLRVPVRTPVILLFLHLGVWIWTRYLASFEVFYSLRMIGEMGGIYEVRPGIALLLAMLSIACLGLTLFEVRLVRWVLISEHTAFPVADHQDQEPDIPAGKEHIYEAQMILNNLGYDVGGIDGTIGALTRKALKKFQASCSMNPSGELTMLTVVELRSKWTGSEEPAPGQSIRAISEHVVRRTVAYLASWWGWTK